MNQPLQVMVEELRQALGYPAPGPARDGDTPRYELFHAANSICSQKVRAVLAHHRIPFISQSMSIVAGQTYLPSYVRVRMIGCQGISRPLASTHTGSTAVSSGGCDGAVVPTLVDWGSNEVVVDSKRICDYLDERSTEPLKLRPDGLAAEIDAQLQIVDELPNYQMLMGKPPGGGETPVTRKGGGGPDFALSKVARCERYLEEFADDALLVQAYSAKRYKELQAASQLFSAEAMKAAYNAAEMACTELEEKLNRRGSTWLLGESVSTADLFWAVELLRMKNLGADSFWNEGRLPHVAQYLNALEDLPSIRTAVLEWPGALF